MPSPVTDHSQVEDTGSGSRLDSWKEIATYLCRGERTVKRWEVERGLPVRRVPGAGRATVYAYSHELDEWLKSSSDKLTDSLFIPMEVDRSSASLEAHSDPASTVDHLRTPEVSLSTPADSWMLHVRRLVHFSREKKWSFAACCLLAMGIAVGASARALYRGARSGVATTPHLGSTSDSRLRETVSDSEKQTAHELYLKGRFEWNKRTADSLNRALDDFTQSIAHDPTSALAYAGLADTYILFHEYSTIPAAEAYSLAIAAATKAIALDDSLADAHRSLGFAEAWGNWDFHGADREFRRAITLNPRDPLTHLWFATAFEAPSWHAYTDREFALAQELDPTSAVVLANKSIWLFDSGQRRAGLELAHQVEHNDPDFVAPHRYLAMMYWSLRDYPNFILESDKTAALLHDPLLKKVNAAARTGYEKHGERGLLGALYVARKAAFQSEQALGDSLPEVCVRLDKLDEAFEVLQYDADHHRAGLLAVLTNPDVQTMANDPRFQGLFARLNYPDPPSIER